MNQTDTLHAATPWYREPWPWILMSGPAIVIVAAFVTLYLAVTRSDPLVVDNYYKEGLAINRVLARDHAAQASGYRAQVIVSDDRRAVRLLLSGNGTLPDRLRLHFMHPTRSGLDQHALLEQMQPGWYEGRMQLAASARWDVTLEDLEQRWRLTGQWDPAQSAFALEARVGSR
jgi:hypothetical protein